MPRRYLAVLLGTLLVAAVASQPATAAPGDPYFADQWGLARIQAEKAWAVATGTGALIAIVDSGVDLGHPDLDAQIVAYPDADFVEPSGNCTKKTCVQDGAQDENGHGTHVAGIAAAETGNGIGVAGTAPGAQILPVRVLDSNGDGTTEDVAAGIRYAANKGAQVINLSLGYDPRGLVAKITGDLDPVYEAIDHAWASGAVVVVAAGNDSMPLCEEPSAHLDVLCVGATDTRDIRSYYSSGDATMTQNYVVAPGGAGTEIVCSEEVFSTYLRTASSFCSDEAGYEGISGTSMSAPFVSGIAALLAGQGLSNTEIVACITETSDDLGPIGRDPLFGFGRVNAYTAVTEC